MDFHVYYVQHCDFVNPINVQSLELLIRSLLQLYSHPKSLSCIDVESIILDTMS